MFICTEVLVKSDMRRRNCFWLNQKVSDNSGYDTEVLYGPIELWIMFEIFFLQKILENSKRKKVARLSSLLGYRLPTEAWICHNLVLFLSFPAFVDSYLTKNRDHIASVKHYFNRICFISFNDFLMLDYLHLSLIVKDCRLLMTLL